MVRVVKLPLNRDQLENVFKSYDTDGDGKLSKDEVRQAFKYLGSRWSSYRTTKAFHKADSNKNGFIDLHELMDTVNYAFDCGYEARAFRALRRADGNKDGYVNLDLELDNLVKYAIKHGYTIK